MTRVGGIGGAATPARQAARPGGGFALPDAPGGRAAAAVAAASSASLLALQEGPGADQGAEERARRRGRAALDLLREVQIDLLCGGDTPACLARLASLAKAAEADASPADPGLRAVLAEVALRVRVELARRRVAHATDG
jgi:hypothetical protein